MQVTSIRVTAARGFNHPHESFANFRFEISQEASLDANDDPETVRLALQRETERAAETHKRCILDDIERLRLIHHGEQELSRLKARQKQDDGIAGQITKLEETLAKLTAAPLVLAPKNIHPGHPEHPATDDFEHDQWEVRQ